MDLDIRTALTDLKTDLKTDLREGFDRQSKQIDAMVTRGEFTATVERLDSMLVNLRRDFDGHEADMDGFRVTTRWAITLSATGAGILVALLSWLLGLA